jgi:predicted MFS family arabinose efflux permease
MAAMALAFVFMFVELNKLLEALNLPGKRAKCPDVKYATGSRGLMFICSLCKYIPLFFFIHIVESIYETNPVSWLPAEIAMIFPLGVAMLMIAVGKTIIESFFKPNPRTFMMVGCVLGAAGFLVAGTAANYFVLLAYLAVTYIGLSMVFQCLWDYIWYAAKFADKYPDLKMVSPNATWGEYTGYTVGAVLGAMAYERFGLYAAMVLAAAICLVLFALIRAMLPKTGYSYTDPEEQEEVEGEHYSLFRFFKSKKMSFYLFLAVLPIAVFPMFVNQFSPIYAETLGLSTSAVSWTSLLQVLFLAFIAPPILLRLVNRFSHTSIVSLSNVVAAVALLLFAVFPGIPTLFAASALIGLALGLGDDAIEWAFWNMDEADMFTGSAVTLAAFRVGGGQIGVAVFTAAFAVSVTGQSSHMAAIIAAIAVFLLVCSGVYAIYQRKKGVDK